MIWNVVEKNITLESLDAFCCLSEALFKQSSTGSVVAAVHTNCTNYLCFWRHGCYCNQDSSCQWGSVWVGRSKPSCFWLIVVLCFSKTFVILRKITSFLATDALCSIEWVLWAAVGVGVLCAFVTHCWLTDHKPIKAKKVVSLVWQTSSMSLEPRVQQKRCTCGLRMVNYFPHVLRWALVQLDFKSV